MTRITRARLSPRDGTQAVTIEVRDKPSLESPLACLVHFLTTYVVGVKVRGIREIRVYCPTPTHTPSAESTPWGWCVSAYAWQSFHCNQGLWMFMHFQFSTTFREILQVFWYALVVCVADLEQDRVSSPGHGRVQSVFQMSMR